MPLSKRTIGKHVGSSKLDKTGFDNFDSPRSSVYRVKYVHCLFVYSGAEKISRRISYLGIRAGSKFGFLKNFKKAKKKHLQFHTIKCG